MEKTQLPSFLHNLDPGIFVNDNCSWLVVDFETTNIEKGSALNKDNRLLLACWNLYNPYEDVITKHWKFGPEYDQQELLDHIKQVDFIVAHNGKFELQWLKRCGLDLRDVLCYDTMLGEWVIAGNRSFELSLEATAQRYGYDGKESLVSKLIKNGVNPDDIPKEWLLDYCQQDVDLTEQIFLQQRDRLKGNKLLHLQYTRCLLTSCLADIEFNGLTLDKERVDEEYERVFTECKDLKRTLGQLTGGINFRSRPQLAGFLYDTLGFKEKVYRGKPDRTATGNRKTDAATLSGLKATTKEQQEFLDAYKKLAKSSDRLSKSLNFFKTICEKHDCTFYGIFNQGITDTHRLSSSGRKVLLSDPETGEEKESGPQLQNIPREYKRLFKAKLDDWVIVDPDGSGMEFRVAADMGHDQIAYQEIVDGVDIHSITAEVFLKNGTQPEFKGLKTVKEARQPAKPQTFKPLYGGTGITSAEKEYCEFFQKKYDGIYKTQYGWTTEVLKTKQLRTPYGMIFYWPDTTLLSNGRVSNSFSIFNYPVQGFATAEIIPIAVIYLWHLTKDLRVKIISTVHDNVPMEVHKDDVATVREICAECFTKRVYNFLEVCYNYKFKVPLGVGFKAGKHWGEGPELTTMVFPDKPYEVNWKEK